MSILNLFLLFYVLPSVILLCVHNYDVFFCDAECSIGEYIAITLASIFPFVSFMLCLCYLSYVLSKSTIFEKMDRWLGKPIKKR